MTTSRALTLPILLIVASLAGCASSCSPVEVPTQVALALVEEELRTLPILASGATSIAGEDVPDAHGRAEFQLVVTHNGLDNASLAFSNIDIRGFTLAVNVDGRMIPVKLVKVEGASTWTRVAENRWNGAGDNGTRIVVWWTVDFDPSDDPLAIALPEGRAYSADIEFDWVHHGCYARASGHHVEHFSDFVEASVNARTFEATRAPTLEVTAAGVGFSSEYRVRSGLNATIRSVEARAVRFGPPVASVNASAQANGTLDDAGGAVQVTSAVDLGALPSTVSLVLFPQLATVANGARVTSVSPSAPFELRSVAVGSDAYATSGTMLPAPFPPGPAVYVVTVRITYTPSDPTLGVTTDVLATPVVVRG